jgi:hypothetical protein
MILCKVPFHFPAYLVACERSYIVIIGRYVALLHPNIVQFGMELWL